MDGGCVVAFMTETATYATPSSVPSSGASARSIVALVLGILGLLSCWLLSPLAWYLGRCELKDIRSGLAPREGDAVATIAVVLGIIGTILLGLLLLAILAVVAVAVVAIVAGVAH